MISRFLLSRISCDGSRKRCEEPLHCSLVVRGVLGPDLHDMKEVSILGRKHVWTTGGIVVFEADSAHAKKIIEELG